MLGQQLRNLRSAERRPPIGMVHHERALAAELVPDRECRADRAARIAGRRLNVDPSKWRHPPHLAVGDGVHRTAAGQREIGQSGTLLQTCREDERTPPRTSPGPSERCRDADPRADRSVAAAAPTTASSAGENKSPNSGDPSTH